MEGRPFGIVSRTYSLSGIADRTCSEVAPSARAHFQIDAKNSNNEAKKVDGVELKDLSVEDLIRKAETNDLGTFVRVYKCDVY
jgi:hypothetical protein